MWFQRKVETLYLKIFLGERRRSNTRLGDQENEPLGNEQTPKRKKYSDRCNEKKEMRSDRCRRCVDNGIMPRGAIGSRNEFYAKEKRDGITDILSVSTMRARSLSK